MGIVKWVVSHCNNAVVVSVLNSQYSRDKDLMQLLHCLFFLEAQLQFQLSGSHIPGVTNSCTDDLSRNQLPAFINKMPHADTYPTPIPSSQTWTGPHLPEPSCSVLLSEGSSTVYTEDVSSSIA